LSEALDVAVRDLLPTIAHDVLGRELQLKSADLATIVASALERSPDARVLAIRAHSDDFEALADVGLDRIVDNALQPGDAVIELHSGTIDLRLSARLKAILAASLE